MLIGNILKMIDIETILRDRNWHKKEPAGQKQLQDLIGNAVPGLPQEYIAFLQFSNGGQGSLGKNPGWFQLWAAEEVIELNKGYQIDKDLPGYFGFGSNGGGELFAFEIIQGQPWKIVMIPFIPMEANEAITITNDFEEFIQAIGQEYVWP